MTMHRPGHVLGSTSGASRTADLPGRRLAPWSHIAHWSVAVPILDVEREDEFRANLEVERRQGSKQRESDRSTAGCATTTGAMSQRHVHQRGQGPLRQF